MSRGKQCTPPHLKAYSEEEEAEIRRIYSLPRERRSEEIKKNLPGRSRGAVTQHAQKMKVVWQIKDGREWTGEDDQLREWFGRLSVSKMVKKFGRKWSAIHRRAMELGLRYPEGMVTLSEASRQLECSRPMLLKLLERRGVQVSRWKGRDYRGRSKLSKEGRQTAWLMVDLERAREALQEEMLEKADQPESIYAASKRLKVPHRKLYEELEKMKAYEKGARAVAVRLPREIVEKAARRVQSKMERS